MDRVRRVAIAPPAPGTPALPPATGSRLLAVRLPGGRLRGRRRRRGRRRESTAGARPAAGRHRQRRRARRHGHRRRRRRRSRPGGRVPPGCGADRRPQRVRGRRSIRGPLRGPPFRRQQRDWPRVRRPPGVGPRREALAAFPGATTSTSGTTRSSTSIRWATTCSTTSTNCAPSRARLPANARDRFHFTYETEVWEQLAQSGVSAGYGAEWALISRSPPREIAVAFTEPGSPATEAGIARGARIVTVDGVDVENGSDVDTLNAGPLSGCGRRVPRVRAARPRCRRDADGDSHVRGDRVAAGAARSDPRDRLGAGRLHALQHAHRTGGATARRCDAAIRSRVPWSTWWWTCATTAAASSTSPTSSPS